MNYYERHIGDYARDAAHLSMLEHGAYTVLLDRYYSTEQPIPADQAHRICRARTKEERAAVDTVLSEFFTLMDGKYSQKRVNAEIARFRESEPDREAKRENERERQRRTRERRKELFDLLRTHGIVPAYDTPMSELQSLASRVPSRVESQPVTPPVTRDNTATHTHYPDTNNQKEEKGEARKRASPPPCPAGVDEQVWADWLQLRRSKRAPVTATVLQEAHAEAAKAGMSLDAFLRAWCRRGSQGLEAAWLRPEERAPMAKVVPMSKPDALALRNIAVAQQFIERVENGQ